MNKLNSKLFKKFELKTQDYSSIVGGNYTAIGEDTNGTDGGHDISFDTLDQGGGSTGIDVQGTGKTTRDKPGDCLYLAPGQ